MVLDRAAVLGLRSCPRWLRRQDLLRNWASTLEERQTRYATFVDQGLTEELWEPEIAAAAQCLIGSDSFVDRMRRGLTDLSRNVNVRRESVQERALRAWCSLAQLTQLVAEAYGCYAHELLRTCSRHNETRQVLLYLTSIYCRGRYSLAESGMRLGPITVSGLGSAREIMKQRLRASRSLRDRIAQLETRIAAFKSKSDD